ncbi:SLBB domain-containing protein [Leucothrix arctica]|uniref:Polysaccharide export protein n=1 Tax=Leucothrix arctica TaxID=1481894 RepID=A0A317CKM5_9GAMM|nr:polysaccharide biosynthesis/export family protein [Leucothrix arctica]PWQ98721.1 hypothetical protein DKT75_02620 [Leucothrix arctica]
MKKILLVCLCYSLLTACMPVKSNSEKSSPSYRDVPSVSAARAATIKYPPLIGKGIGESAEYKIGFFDLLDIKVFDADELTLTTRVDARGYISMPLLGSVLSAGLSSRQLEHRLEGMLRKDLLQNPKVTVFVVEHTAQRVTIEGEVKRPGVFPIKGNVTVLQAVATAGGLAEFAVADSVVLFRKSNSGVRGYSVNLSAIRNGQQGDPLVKNEDRIVVSRLEQRVTLEGEVVRPSVYPYKDKMTVLQAIALGGGLTGLAAPEKIILFRRSNGEERLYHVDLSAIRAGKSVDPYIAHDDRIVVHRSNSRYWLKEASTVLAPLSLLNGLL